MSDSLQPHGLQPTRLLRPWDFPGKSTGVGCHCLLRWMWALDHKDRGALKNWCFWIAVLEKTLQSPLNCKETKPVNPKGNQSWMFMGRTDAEAEAPILWLSDARSWLNRKKTWCWERLRAGWEWGNRGWDCCMASLTRWTWVWASSGYWWWIGKPGLLQSTVWQSVRHDLGTE